ncbi:DUF6415 family natural product biosynthesis protein [Streptomyces sp. NPDC127038]|uniref:DUF6415 family natural product biosynthesis protein n=1 Tax=Streptomyces sp. NPDC127038 TaxID=3347114 RepID=UPI003650D30F
MTATRPHGPHLVPVWTPPLDPDGLHSLLVKVRKWRPFDGEAVLDDVSAVLDEYTPSEEQVAVLVVRLHGHLSRLVEIAVASNAAPADGITAQLIAKASTVQCRELPGDYLRAVGQLRRTGWIVNELFERLIVLGCLREAA